MLMGQLGRVRAMVRTTRELTDAQWAKLAPLLPPQRPRMGRPPKDHRLVVEAIVWLDRTGAPWRPGGARPRPTCRARGALADPDQPGDREALGRSRGGYSTKLHLRVEGRGRPMVVLASAGQRHEAPMLRRLVEAGAVK